jgi:hypothetical protein
VRINYQCKNMVASDLRNLPQDTNRTYLCVIADTDVTVTLSGGRPFVIGAGSQWAPIPAPQNDIVLAGTGTLILG